MEQQGVDFVSAFGRTNNKHAVAEVIQLSDYYWSGDEAESSGEEISSGSVGANPPLDSVSVPI